MEDEHGAEPISGTLVPMDVLARRTHSARHAGRRPARTTARRVATSIGLLVAVLMAVVAFGTVGGGSAVLRTLGLAPSAPVREPSSSPSSGPARPPHPATVSSSEPPRTPSAARWRAVLYQLDRIRARAWRQGDPDLLRAVYAAGSPALDSDRHLLADYARRGLRVRDVRLRFGRLEVVQERPGWVRFTVVDRLAAATAVSAAGSRLPLPRDRPTRHRVVLRRVGGAWRIDRVSVV